jgi:hypothetical protein
MKRNTWIFNGITIRYNSHTKASKYHLHRTRMGEQGRVDMEVCQGRQRIFMKLWWNLPYPRTCPALVHDQWEIAHPLQLCAPDRLPTPKGWLTLQFDHTWLWHTKSHYKNVLPWNIYQQQQRFGPTQPMRQPSRAVFSWKLQSYLSGQMDSSPMSSQVPLYSHYI